MREQFGKTDGLESTAGPQKNKVGHDPLALPPIGPTCHEHGTGYRGLGRTWPTKMMPIVWASREAPSTLRMKCGEWFRSEIPPLCLRSTAGSELLTRVCGSVKARKEERARR